MFWFAGLLFLCTISLTSQASPKKGLLFGSAKSDFINFRWYSSSVTYQSCLCMWVKNIAPSSYPTPWSYYYSSYTTSWINSNGYHTQLMDDGSLNGKLTSKFGSIPKGRWFHACYNWKYNRNIQVYLNGTLIATSTSSRGEHRGGGYGYIMLGNYVKSQHTSYAFGGELTNLNLFSRELSAAEIKKQYDGGPCFIDSTLRSYKTLSWETLLGKSRSGVVKDTYIDCQLYEDLKTTSTQRDSTSRKLESTSAILKTSQENYKNATAALTKAKAQLVSTQNLLNYTKCHSLLDDCKAGLDNATQQLSIKPTHWDILLKDDLNKILTDKRLGALKSVWDYLDSFVGINMTRTIIHHLNRYHGHDKNEDHEGWDVLEDFIGVTMSEKVIQHLKEKHKISEEDIADFKKNGTASELEQVLV